MTQKQYLKYRKNLFEGIAVYGRDSKIGSALLDTGKICSSTSRRLPKWNLDYFDLNDPPEEWHTILPCKSAIICIGQTKIAECKAHPRYTRKINVDRTIELLKRLNNNGVFSIFISTNLVEKREKERPLYAKQKLEVESFIRKNKLWTYTIRLPKVVTDKDIREKVWTVPTINIKIVTKILIKRAKARTPLYL